MIKLRIMKVYKNFKEIDNDVKMLSLERKIALEELKIKKNEFEESLKPINVAGKVLKFFSKYGALMLAKKLFK